MSHVNEEPDYYLARCCGDDYEKTEAAEFHRQGSSSDRDVVIAGLRHAGADSDLIALVESGADVSYPHTDVYKQIVKVLRAAA